MYLSIANFQIFAIFFIFIIYYPHFVGFFCGKNWLDFRFWTIHFGGGLCRILHIYPRFSHFTAPICGLYSFRIHAGAGVICTYICVCEPLCEYACACNYPQKIFLYFQKNCGFFWICKRFCTHTSRIRIAYAMNSRSAPWNGFAMNSRYRSMNWHCRVIVVWIGRQFVTSPLLEYVCHCTAYAICFSFIALRCAWAMNSRSAPWIGFAMNSRGLLPSQFHCATSLIDGGIYFGQIANDFNSQPQFFTFLAPSGRGLSRSDWGRKQD